MPLSANRSSAVHFRWGSADALWPCHRLVCRVRGRVVVATTKNGHSVESGLDIGTVGTQAAFAGSPHFVGDITVTRSGSTLTVSGKEAGLGNEDQVHIVVTATAL